MLEWNDNVVDIDGKTLISSNCTDDASEDDEIHKLSTKGSVSKGNSSNFEEYTSMTDHRYAVLDVFFLSFFLFFFSLSSSFDLTYKPARLPEEIT